MAKWLKAPIAFRRVIVAAGGGAGIAAVFSAPLGGFIYLVFNWIIQSKGLFGNYSDYEIYINIIK